jgi:murein DD-endopeptidase MepM/ murein hydrolase activator NlpD
VLQNPSRFGTCEVLRWMGALIALTLVCPAPAKAWHRSVTLKSLSQQRFVVAENGGGGVVNANRVEAREWETFTLLDLNEGELMNGDLISLRASAGTFVVAEGGGGQELKADRAVPSTWETFQLWKAGSTNTTEVIGTQEQIVLKTLNGGFFVTVAADQRVMANRSVSSGAARVEEKFTLQSTGSLAPMRLSGPFTRPQVVFPLPVGTDQSSTPSSNDLVCTNSYMGPNFPNCYSGHRGTDYPLVGGFPTMDSGIHVVAAAPGKVVQAVDGNPDRCQAVPQINLPPITPPNSPPIAPEPIVGKQIDCPGVPASADKLHNFVVVLQDDGLLAYYFHLKRGSVAVTPSQRVACGQLLGMVGSSGDSTMPHLHFELTRVTSSFPSNRTDYFNENGNQRQGTPVDPYTPILWSSLGGRIPAQTCQHSSTNRQLGESCGVSEVCRADLSCSGGTCKRVGLPPGASCDGNNLCGNLLTCFQGRCAPALPAASGLGGGCGATQPCAVGLVCQSGSCKRVGVGPGGDCDANQLCGPALRCTNGKCRVPIGP